MNGTFQLRYEQIRMAPPASHVTNYNTLLIRMAGHNFFYKILVSLVLLNMLAIFDYGLLSTRVFFTGDMASTAISVLIKKALSYNALWIGACIVYWNISRFDVKKKTSLEIAVFHVTHCLMVAIGHQLVISWSVSTDLFPNPYYQGTMLKAFIMGLTGLFHINILFYIGIISLGQYLDYRFRTNENTSFEKQQRDNLVIKDPGRILFLEKSEILYIKSEQNYLAIYTRNSIRPILTRKTMRELLASMEPSVFIQVHRSYIVHKNRIVEIIRSKNGVDYAVKLVDNTVIPVSRANKTKLFKQVLVPLHSYAICRTRK